MSTYRQDTTWGDIQDGLETRIKYGLGMPFRMTREQIMSRDPEELVFQHPGVEHLFEGGSPARPAQGTVQDEDA